MNVQLRPPSMLREKQLLIARYMIGERQKWIVSGMGSGKTGASLTAMRRMLDCFMVRHWLVIAPKLVAERTWPDEIEEWEHTQCLSYAVAVGTEKQRIEAINKRAEVTTINFENLQWLAKHIGSVDNWIWDGVIIDESSRMKAGKKRTARARVKDRKTGTVKVRKGGNMTRFGVLTAARRKINYIYELTGTPFPQGIHDAWGQAYVLDQGERLGRTMTAFEERWFEKNAYTHQIKEREGARADIMGRISDLMVSIPSDKLVEEPRYIPVRVKLPPKVIRDYKAFEETLYSEAYDVEAVSRGVLANKLMQFANGSMYREDGSIVPVHGEKLAAVEELVKQAAGQNVIIWYGFKFDLEALRKKYPHAVVANEDPEAIKKWNAGQVPVLLAHPASLGHGTNLQYGGHIAIWYGLTFSLELYLQANMRLPRPGQKEQVLIYQIIAEETYDERALNLLSARDATQESLVQSVLHTYP